MADIDERNNNEVEDIEIVIGDNSNLEISDVEEFITELKPIKEKKKNLVIPVSKSEKDKSKKKN